MSHSSQLRAILSTQKQGARLAHAALREQSARRARLLAMRSEPALSDAAGSAKGEPRAHCNRRV